MDSNVSLPKGWTAPSELTGALPRKTRMAPGGVQLVVLATVFLLWGGTWLFFCCRGAAQEMARTAALRRGSSRETTGEVTWVSSRAPHRLSYAFTANGVALTGECSLPSHLYFRRGDNLIIRFLPSNPAMNHPADWEGPAPDWWVPCVFAAFLALISTPLIVSLRRDRRLVAEGVPVGGVVLKCSPRGRGGWTAKYEFRTEDGRVAEGSSDCWNRLEAGSAVCVLYHPQNPRRNKAYSAVTYRVAQ